MTLAEDFVLHCTQQPSEGFGALMGTTRRLADLLEKYRGRSIHVAEGVSVLIPKECTWQTTDISDGSVQFSFAGALPRVGAEFGIVRVTPEITSLVVRIGAAALEIQASTRVSMVPMPPYTVTIRLV